MQEMNRATESTWRPGWRTIAVTVVMVLVLVLWIEDLHFIRRAGNPAESVPPAISVGLTLIAAVLAWIVARYVLRRRLQSISADPPSNLRGGKSLPFQINRRSVDNPECPTQ